MPFCDVRLWQVCGRDSIIPFLILVVININHFPQKWDFVKEIWKKLKWNVVDRIKNMYFWVSSMELGLFIFISLEPKSQWSAMKKAKPLNVNGPRPTLT